MRANFIHTSQTLQSKVWTAHRPTFDPNNVFTLCTTWSTIRYFFFLPTQGKCFVWISGQTAMIPLHWLIFITVAACVYCEVRTDTLNVIQVNTIL